MEPFNTYFNWSTGKDSAMALHRLLQQPEYNVTHLLTSVNAAYGRVSMHGVRVELLQRQMEAIGLPFSVLSLPAEPTNEQYEQIVAARVAELKEGGCTHAAFGDIYLEDLRRYREEQLAKVGLSAVFPLWGENTAALMEHFCTSGFRAVVVCVNASLLDESFVGRELDADFVRDLPPGVDPCGENGEFHTFCYDAPFYREAVPFERGEIVYREYDNAGSNNGFWFADLLPL